MSFGDEVHLIINYLFLVKRAKICVSKMLRNNLVNYYSNQEAVTKQPSKDLFT